MRRGGSTENPTDPAERSADRALAAACGRGEASAIAEFERAYFPEADRAASRARMEPAELKQALRERLFAGSSRGEPRIREYTGRSSLRAWFRVVTARMVVDWARHEQLGRRGDGAAALPSLHASDPELAYMRHAYRREFEEAFATATRALTPQQRNLLWYAAVEGNTVNEIAAILGVPRSTAARWVADARQNLMRLTRERLMAQLKLTPSELESILRLLQSHLHVSLSRLLSAPSPS